MRRIGFIGGRNDDHDDPALWGFGDIDGCWHVLDQKAKPWTGSGVPHESYAIACPYGVPGERLFVREAWGLARTGDASDWHRGSLRGEGANILESWSVEYAADWGTNQENCYWRPSIHMPRWASRITLEITDVRVQRLADISEEDARAEGFPLPGPVATRLRVKQLDGSVTESIAQTQFFDARTAFCATWEALNGVDGRRWSDNPYVWCLSFKRIEQGAAHVAA